MMMARASVHAVQRPAAAEPYPDAKRMCLGRAGKAAVVGAEVAAIVAAHQETMRVCE